MRYKVNIRKSVEDEWTDEYYNEPFIEAESKEEAEDIAKSFIRDCGYNPDEYDYLVTEAAFMELETCCRNCKYHVKDAIGDGMCTNAESDAFADLTDDSDVCGEWSEEAISVAYDR